MAYARVRDRLMKGWFIMFSMIDGILSDILHFRRNKVIFSLDICQFSNYVPQVGTWMDLDDLDIVMYLSAIWLPTFKYKKQKQEAFKWYIDHLEDTVNRTENLGQIRDAIKKL